MPRRFFSTKIIFLVLASWLLSLSVSYSEDFTAPVTVANRTPHYLHVTVNGKSFTYLAPGNSVREQIEAHAVTIHVVYSPGQGKSGSFTGNYPTADIRYTPEHTTSSCSGNDNSTCTQTTQPAQTHITPIPVQVEILPDNLR